MATRNRLGLEVPEERLALSIRHTLTLLPVI